MVVLDGNALAGVLTDTLGADPTTVVLRCAGCGTLGELARTRVHVSPMGSVARCRGCDTVLVTVVETPGRRWVGLPGTRAVSTD
ncbi:DUF6510 family protein [Curtobacterium sp. SP.BCo]|uniref:DUF6510 family protein n=1 Tax=Curtobacterium sp. SP.BCo TaxID=3435229 RepID=UPI003F736E32